MSRVLHITTPQFRAALVTDTCADRVIAAAKNLVHLVGMSRVSVKRLCETRGWRLDTDFLDRDRDEPSA